MVNNHNNKKRGNFINSGCHSHKGCNREMLLCKVYICLFCSVFCVWRMCPPEIKHIIVFLIQMTMLLFP